MAIEYTIKGQLALRGTISVKGSPLATVGMLAAALLTSDKVTITNIPHLRDIDLLLQELRAFNVMADWTHDHEITIHADQLVVPQQKLTKADIAGWPASLVAALLVRVKSVTIPVKDIQSYPDTFLWPLLEKFGATITFQQDMAHISITHLHAASLELSEDTAEQTLTAIILAVGADGQTLLGETVINPEVEDVINCLRTMKSEIDRIDEVKLSITGQPELKGTIYPVIMDRYEAAFWATVAIMTAGDIQINDIKSALVLPFLAKLEQMGASYTVDQPAIRVWRDRHQDGLSAITLTAKPFPGLGDDWLLLCMPLQSIADGESVLQSADQSQINLGLTALRQFGGEGHSDHLGVHVFGPVKLQAAEVKADQFAVSVVAVLASLAAEGTSLIKQVDSLDDRFESLSERLTLLGAQITRTEHP